MRVLVVAVLLLAPIIAGCVQPPADTATPPGGSADASTPLSPIPERITKLEPVSHVEFGGGNDMAFRDQYAYVSSSSGLHIIDLSDPAKLVEVGSVPCTGSDVNIVETATRRIAVVSSQSSDDKCEKPAPEGGMRLVDVTDPASPVVLSQVPLKYGSHTATAYGDTGLIFNSAYDLTNPMAHHRSEIVDVSDPLAPKVVGEFLFPQSSTSAGCHDILAEVERSRMICAGLTETMIWDMKDPQKPRVVTTIDNPAISIHHSVATAREGTLLIIGDEFAGVLAPGCHPAAGAPTGALWFYDLKDVANPKPLGFFPPPAGSPGDVCSAHNFGVIEGKDMVVSGFYEGGTILVDFKDPSAPKQVSHQKPQGANSWASYHYRGLILSGELSRGLDVYVLK